MEKLSKVTGTQLKAIAKEIAGHIAKKAGISAEEAFSMIREPPQLEMGDLAFPCFGLAGRLKKAPKEIADEIVKDLSLPKIVRKTESVAGYVNMHLDREKAAKMILDDFFKGKTAPEKIGEGLKVIVEMSSPNIAKSFGIGHLRSTIIGESLARIYTACGYSAIRMNYLGDWGTQFGKLIYGYKRFGDEKEMEKDAISHLQEIYVRINREMTPEIEERSKEYFRRLEEGDKEILSLWQRFRELSLKEFEKIYRLLGVRFDVITGESEQNRNAKRVIKELLEKGIATESDGAIIVDLTKEGKHVVILEKSDGTTIYTSRDIAAAIERMEKYRFDRMIYEVGSEQKMHFIGVFRILEMMGYSWHDRLVHVSHGLYLGKDGKKLSTRKGSSLKMKDLWDEVYAKVLKEIRSREDISEEELEERAVRITRAAILYGDLSNYREGNIVFDTGRITRMEGDTGPYLLYSYARSRSILKKIGYSRPASAIAKEPDSTEYALLKRISEFPQAVLDAHEKNDPSKVANYAMELAKAFNSFYTKNKVAGSSDQEFKAQLVDSYSAVLKSALELIGIETIERM